MRGAGEAPNEGKVEGNEGTPDERFDGGEVLSGKDCSRFFREVSLRYRQVACARNYRYGGVRGGLNVRFGAL